MIKYSEIIIGILVVIAVLCGIRTKLVYRKQRQIIETFHFTPEEVKEIRELANKYFIAPKNIIYLAKIFTYNQSLKGEKIPLSNNLVIALDKLKFEEYKTLTERYKVGLKEAEKIKHKDNCPKKYLINYVKGDLILASLGEMLLPTFDSKKLGETWRKQANSGFLKVIEENKKKKERFEKIRNSPDGELKTGWWDDSDHFDGFGGSSGGGGGDAFW